MSLDRRWCDWSDFSETEENVETGEKKVTEEKEVSEETEGMVLHVVP